MAIKTIKEWLQELPEPARSEALNNAEQIGNWKPEIKTAEDINEALLNAFPFRKSPEGLGYWINIFSNL